MRQLVTGQAPDGESVIQGTTIPPNAFRRDSNFSRPPVDVQAGEGGAIRGAFQLVALEPRISKHVGCPLNEPRGLFGINAASNKRLYKCLSSGDITSRVNLARLGGVPSALRHAPPL